MKVLFFTNSQPGGDLQSSVIIIYYIISLLFLLGCKRLKEFRLLPFNGFAVKRRRLATVQRYL